MRAETLFHDTDTIPLSKNMEAYFKEAGQLDYLTQIKFSTIGTWSSIKSQDTETEYFRYAIDPDTYKDPQGTKDRICLYLWKKYALFHPNANLIPVTEKPENRPADYQISKSSPPPYGYAITVRKESILLHGLERLEEKSALEEADYSSWHSIISAIPSYALKETLSKRYMQFAPQFLGKTVSTLKVAQHPHALKGTPSKEDFALACFFSALLTACKALKDHYCEDTQIEAITRLLPSPLGRSTGLYSKYHDAPQALMEWLLQIIRVEKCFLDFQYFESATSLRLTKENTLEANLNHLRAVREEMRHSPIDLGFSLKTISDQDFEALLTQAYEKDKAQKERAERKRKTAENIENWKNALDPKTRKEAKTEHYKQLEQQLSAIPQARHALIYGKKYAVITATSEAELKEKAGSLSTHVPIESYFLLPIAENMHTLIIPFRYSDPKRLDIETMEERLLNTLAACTTSSTHPSDIMEQFTPMFQSLLELTTGLTGECQLIKKGSTSEDRQWLVQFTFLADLKLVEELVSKLKKHYFTARYAVPSDFTKCCVTISAQEIIDHALSHTAKRVMEAMALDLTPSAQNIYMERCISLRNASYYTDMISNFFRSAESVLQNPQSVRDAARTNQLIHLYNTLESDNALALTDKAKYILANSSKETLVMVQNFASSLKEDAHSLFTLKLLERVIALKTEHPSMPAQQQIKEIETIARKVDMAHFAEKFSGQNTETSHYERF